MPTTYPGTDIYTGPCVDPVAAFGLASITGPFRLTHERALDLAAMHPVSRNIALQDAYTLYLCEQARLRHGALIRSKADGYAVARRWDAEGAQFMAEAQAEFDRALGTVRELAA